MKICEDFLVLLLIQSEMVEKLFIEVQTAYRKGQ